MSDTSPISVGAILLTACLVAIVSQRLRIPYSVGLLLAGVALALAPWTIDLPLTRELIFSVFLPPLVFQAAIELRWLHFRRNLPLTLLLALPGVVISAGVVAVGAYALLGWSPLGAAFFGVLIAATDPVAVIATFKTLNTEGRLKLLVESESLLNDGTAAVGFGVLTGLAAGAGTSPLAIGGELLSSISGGVASGVATAGLLLVVAGRTEDHLVEITLTALAAYGSFFIAEHFHVSGVLASLSAGLVVGNQGWKGAISGHGRDHVLAFWDFAAFLMNSVVFILIGGHEAHQPLARVGAAAAIAAGLVLLGRACAVYPLAALVRRTGQRIDARYQHVLFWAGLRGAMALALALSLPPTLAERGEIIAVTFAVVGFSIVVQGLTMPWLVRRLGLVRSAPNEPE
ncbi:MAG: cation:proton antiporter [Gammaproteobacteria bacterium]|nr:cation:proton antiporter [Gammaproteobacteria bacterium]MBI5616521.1 cation:proton antiporter [Gammaproteobacteria bacterium]